MNAIKRTYYPTPIPTRPSLNQALYDIGVMPSEALFLGVAYDNLPVVLNLHDPIPGSILIVGDPGTGKTDMLRTIASAIEKTHSHEEVQFGVVTPHPDEWSGFEKTKNNVGFFSAHHRSSEDFILSLGSWANGNKWKKQSVVLLMDGLESITYMDFDAALNLRWLLSHGAERRVWSIVTLSTKNFERLGGWLESFRTRILGNIKDEGVIRKLYAEKADLGSLSARSEFALYEGENWVKFWIPTLDEKCQ